MDKSRRFADVLRQIRRKSDHVVIRSFSISLIRSTVNAAFAFISARSSARNHPVFGVNFADGDLNIEPFLKFIVKSPNRAHFGQCVSFYHVFFTGYLELITKLDELLID